MQHLILTVKDTKIDAYLKPFYVHSEEHALRDMTTIANTPEHPIGKNVEDYSLYLIGTYEDTTGKIISLDLPKHITNLLDLKKDK
jgi:hypothetical protein